MAGALPFVGPAMGLIGALTGSASQSHAENAASNAASQATAAENKLIQGSILPLIQNQILPLFQKYGPQVIDFFLKQSQQGFDPQTIGAMLNAYDSGTSSDIASMRNSLGAGLPNVAGSVADMLRNAAMGRANLLSGIAGQDQQFKSQGMQDVWNTVGSEAGGLGSIVNTLGGLAGTYGQAAGQAANNLSQAAQYNPWSSFGQTMAGVDWSKYLKH